MIRSESISKISTALLKAQKAMGVAKKDADNPFFNSVYADLNSIRAVVMPPLHENGITVLQTTNLDTLNTILLHESGEYIGSEIKIVTKDDKNPQAYGSAISYARRYSLQAMLCVGAEDDDGEKATGRSSAAPVRQVTKNKKINTPDDF